MEPSSSTSSFSEKEWKRFQDDEVPHVPILTLDREGNIETFTPAARRLLEYSDDTPPDECFFAHVHKRNMGRVMRDLADMVSRGKQSTRWLLRLRTGNDRWRWYRAFVQNNLGRQGDHVRVRLRSL
ncbi:MAG: hypothetical protein BRD35_06905 [Bacteroidetes bacterium QH_7_62_13]|nr:MAG: hypothetical protein BRD35_06905 [Bacteroidetes bacterium QH_7_62_13]